MNDNEMAVAELKSFTTEELHATAAALEAAKHLRASFAAVTEGHQEDLVDLVAEFAFDETLTDFDEKIALVRAELATRNN